MQGNPHATITLAYHGLELRCPSANISEDRPLTDKDLALLTAWANNYQALARQEHPADGLLKLGQELFDWLNGSTQFLTRLVDTAQPPLLVEFAVSKQDDSPQARAFLDAPWELLASDGIHWALRQDTNFCPIRRIGKAMPPPTCSPNCLSVVFMAAAPRNAGNLNYEDEEASILKATRDIGLDLVVEESGTLDLLSAVVARERPDVIEISCHGTLKPEPGLLLEDEVGDAAYAKSSQLVNKLGSNHPRLLFLSACETAEAHPVLDSLARSLVRSGAPAVLGWGAPVLDLEATLFAAFFYGRLTAGDDLAHALAYARLELSESKQLPEPPGGGLRSHDWHLARLYYGPNGGGALATAGGPRRLVDRGRAVKAFLDMKSKQVPVAGELEFVGRRRDIQRILREFRAQASRRSAGVFVHGMGRQGKSSLAARIAYRLEHSHELIVLFGRYDASAILAAFRDRLATPEVTEIVKRHLPHVEENPTSLLPALTELIEGPCQQVKKDAGGRAVTRPVLLVIDDFEQALEARPTGPHCLKAEFVESIRAVILSFRNAQTESRLLFTSRYRFTLPDDGNDLATCLLDVPLHGMDRHESRKQATAKLRLQAEDPRLQAKNLPALFERVDRILAAALGNPGLQNILFSLCLDDPAACDRCLAQMEEFQQTGKTPSEDKVREFLENLAIEALLRLLTPAHRELLRCLTLFELPALIPVLERLSHRSDQPVASESLARLAALGLIEVYEDLHRPQEPALAINALVRPLAGNLSVTEQQTLAGLVVTKLFEQWGGEAGAKQRGYLQDYELTRLALLAREPRALAATAADTLRFLEGQFAYRQAAKWARNIMTILDGANAPVSVDLLRTAAECLLEVGEVSEADTLLQRALTAIEQGQLIDTQDHAAALITHARRLVVLGQPNEALKYFEQAKALLPPGRERAVTLGDIAEIRQAKGEVDAALELHQEALAVFEELGEKRERAITLVDIAGIETNIGEVDAALELYEEALAVCAELGDKKGRAVTLGKIARIRTTKGEVDAALQLHEEALAVYEELKDKRSRAQTLGDIARIRMNEGEVDAALRLLQEVLAACEELGDKDGIANTLWSLAQIEIKQEKFEEAAGHLAASYNILIEIERLDGICYVGIGLGQLLCASGKREEGLAILSRSRDGFLKLGMTDPAHQTEALINDINKSAP
ncbi:MAG TPA: tetratricopeptide repeat protein [Candidatus Deferrimicrobium sp.]|nr:tetratricopeptide repeat protein [Candidatus Deferrimicrobium sp.]